MNVLLLLVSWLIVGFGMAVFSPFISILSASVGFALFWWGMIQLPKSRSRFYLATAWFTAVQLIQLSWFVSHPFIYIYAAYFFFAGAKGLQFGIVSLFVTKERIQKTGNLFAIAGAWTLMEWLRLFFMAGYTLNPTGLALAANVYSLQSASLVGVYGLTFIVILTNLLFLRYLVLRQLAFATAWVGLTLIPYFFGFVQIQLHQSTPNHDDNTNVLLVQTNFPVEESLDFQSANEMIQYVQGEWQQILKILGKHQEKKVDLIVLPELVVPYSAYYPLFRHDIAKASFETFLDTMGPVPATNRHTSMEVDTPEGKVTMVNHTFWCQAIADLFNACVVVGLEDEDQIDDNTKNYYSSAYVFYPKGIYTGRYEKRVLVPMGEYIPFSALRELAKSYGVTGSFTPGTEAKVFPTRKSPIGLSICYEETFGDMMRENRQKGAELLVNLTNDAWYPHSNLPRQHLEHARVRTTEMGIPLVRACNTGVTCAVDSHGRDLAILQNEKGNVEDIADALYISVPRQVYNTLYSKTGDTPILAASFVFILFGWFSRRER